MDDAAIHTMIEELVAEEHRLWDDEAKGGNTEADRQKLADVKVALDKCWVPTPSAACVRGEQARP